MSRHLTLVYIQSDVNHSVPLADFIRMSPTLPVA